MSDLKNAAVWPVNIFKRKNNLDFYSQLRKHKTLTSALVYSKTILKIIATNIFKLDKTTGACA